MRVGLLTSWRVPCGIYQYTSRLADALADQPDTDVVILAGRADEHRSVPEESDHEVHDVAKIGLWSDDGVYALDITSPLLHSLDVIHVQYQSMLFNQEALAEMAGWFRRHGPIAITFHDNCQRPDFPYDAFNLHFSHRWNVGPPSVEVIPFGIENRPPVVRTFGLGRTRSDYIRPICDRNGWIFEDASTHEPIQGGGQQWRTHQDLIDWLRGADAVVLWYDGNGMAGSSQAARTAIASRRPVITNDTEWFADLPARCDGYRKVGTLEELERVMEATLIRRYTEENSWDRVAQILLDRYSALTVARAT